MWLSKSKSTTVAADSLPSLRLTSTFMPTANCADAGAIAAAAAPFVGVRRPKALAAELIASGTSTPSTLARAMATRTAFLSSSASDRLMALSCFSRAAMRACFSCAAATSLRRTCACESVDASRPSATPRSMAASRAARSTCNAEPDGKSRALISWITADCAWVRWAAPSVFLAASAATPTPSNRACSIAAFKAAQSMFRSSDGAVNC